MSRGDLCKARGRLDCQTLQRGDVRLVRSVAIQWNSEERAFARINQKNHNSHNDKIQENFLTIKTESLRVSKQSQALSGTILETILVFLISYIILFIGMSLAPTIYDEGLILTGAMQVLAEQIPHRDFCALRPRTVLLARWPLQIIWRVYSGREAL